MPTFAQYVFLFNVLRTVLSPLPAMQTAMSVCFIIDHYSAFSSIWYQRNLALYKALIALFTIQAWVPTSFSRMAVEGLLYCVSPVISLPQSPLSPSPFALKAITLSEWVVLPITSESQVGVQLLDDLQSQAAELPCSEEKRLLLNIVS
jgi:hypothetical protein